MKHATCHISKQRMLQPSSHHIIATPTASPEGNQDGNRMPDIKPPDTAAAPSPRVHLRGLRMRRHRTLAPDSWGTYQRNDFSEPRLLHLPIHRKALSSLTWDVWFPLINSHLLMSRLPGFCCKNSCMFWLLLPLRSRPSEILERLPPGLEVLGKSSK